VPKNKKNMIQLIPAADVTNVDKVGMQMNNGID
jgi:hypothetical protein